jgi:hypothetical protein
LRKAGRDLRKDLKKVATFKTCTEDAMSFPADSIDSFHELRTKTPDNRDLVFFTGTALLNFVGQSSEFVRDTVTIPIGPRWARLDSVAPAAALASIFNNQTAVNAGWAADNCNAREVNGQIELDVAIAVSDTDGHLLRVAFQATAIGVLA